MKITFHLRMEKKSVKTGLIPVAILVTEKGLSVRKNIPNVKVLESDWNKESQRINHNKKGEPSNFHFEFNSTLDGIVFRLNESWRQSYLQKSTITEDQIIDAIENKEALAKETIDFIDCFEEFINQTKSIRAVNTIKGYTTTKNVFEKFFNESKIPRTFESIDLKFFDEFRNYCFEEPREFLNNYFAKLIAHLKTFMKWTHDRNYHTNLIYNKFVAPEEDIEVIFLAQDELSLLYNFEFENVTFSKVRDIYCFASFSGLRYSDLRKLKGSDLANGEIKITSKKTKEQDLIIPLHEYSLAVLNKYKETIYYPLPMMSSQKINKYIKEACELAGINSEVTITRYSGSKVIEKVYPKWKRITIHTGRKTYISNSIMFNMEISAIKASTGHKTDRAFQKYLKVTNAYKRVEAQKWNSMLEKPTNQ